MIKRRYATWKECKAVLGRLKIKRVARFVKSLYYYEDDKDHVLEIEFYLTKDSAK